MASRHDGFILLCKQIYFLLNYCREHFQAQPQISINSKSSYKGTVTCLRNLISPPPPLPQLSLGGMFGKYPALLRYLPSLYHTRYVRVMGILYFRLLKYLPMYFKSLSTFLYKSPSFDLYFIHLKYTTAYLRM